MSIIFASWASNDLCLHLISNIALLIRFMAHKSPIKIINTLLTFNYQLPLFERPDWLIRGPVTIFGALYYISSLYTYSKRVHVGMRSLRYHTVGLLLIILRPERSGPKHLDRCHCFNFSEFLLHFAYLMYRLSLSRLHKSKIDQRNTLHSAIIPDAPGTLYS